MSKENTMTSVTPTLSDRARIVTSAGLSKNATIESIKDLIETGTITELNKSRGFDRLLPDTMGIPSYDEATRTFSMSVKGGETYFQYWAEGIRVEKTTTQSIVWDNTTGARYFYFDKSGVLNQIADSDMTYEIFVKNAICGFVGFNATTGKLIVQATDEQHGIGMPAPTHFRLHKRDGAVHLGGGEITGMADGSEVYTSISEVTSADEDINIVTSATTTTPFLYRIGAANAFVETATPDLNLALLDSSKTQYNKEVGGVWSLADATGYVIYVIYWTHDKTNPIKKLVGTENFSSRSEAREALRQQVGLIQKNGLPSPEVYPMFAYIVKTNGDLEDSGSPAHTTYVDLRYPQYFDAE